MKRDVEKRLMNLEQVPVTPKKTRKNSIDEVNIKLDTVLSKVVGI